MVTGRRFRVLNIVADGTRECLAAIPGTSISGKRVIRELTSLIVIRRKPDMIVSDNGTELPQRLCFSGAEMRKSNGIAPRRASQLRMRSLRASTDGCVMNCYDTLFTSIAHARQKVAAWGDDYNNLRPHSSLGYATPAVFAAELEMQGAASLRIAGGYAAQPLASTAQ